MNLWCRLRCAWLCLTRRRLIVGAYTPGEPGCMSANVTILNLTMPELLAATADLNQKGWQLYHTHQQDALVSEATQILNQPQP